MARFVERTTSLTLDPWQQHLCARLERLRYETGQRLLIHAPPQHGKSVIVSQRFPAWLLGTAPAHRVKLACYNVTHATRFSRIVLQLMQESLFSHIFPDAEARVPGRPAGEEWSTVGRRKLRDAQPSCKALGLLTGFVGQGADTLVIDDPYASPQEALSETIRERVWTFWDESARVRLHEQSNVVVMFHRYHEDDLAGRMWASGEWEMLRYAARADGDPEWPDPLGRAVGERLSPRFGEGFYRKQEESGAVWLSQFQGRPSPRHGQLFLPAQVEIVDAAPAKLRRVRAWDLAATRSGGDWTVGLLLGTDGAGAYWVLDVVRGRWGPEERDRMIRHTAQRDGPQVGVWGPQDPGSAGVDAAQAFVRLLAGFAVRTDRATGSKEVRASPVASQLNAGNVRMLRASWCGPLLDELRTFPRGTHDDQVDALSAAFTYLTQARPIELVSL